MKGYYLFRFSIFFILFFIFSFLSFATAALPSDFGLKEGDLISAIFSDDPDVYIINEHGYKRLFLNPEIFKFYAHLGGFTNVKLVTPEVRGAFPTVGLFRNCEKKDPKVYGFESDNEDKGKLRWIDTPGDQAIKDDPDFFKKVFCINDKEFNWYPRGQELKSVKEVPQYHRTTVPATPATPAIPAIPATPASPSQPLTSPTTTPIPTSGSFTPTPVTQPATPATPATPAIPATPAQPAGSLPTPTPTLTVSPTPTATASPSFSPTPVPTSTPTPIPTPTQITPFILEVTDAYVTLGWSPLSSGTNILYRVRRILKSNLDTSAWFSSGYYDIKTFTSGNYNLVFNSNRNTYSFLDTYNIAWNATYEYTVAACSTLTDCNNSVIFSESNPVTAITLPRDVTLPATPANITVVAKSPSQVDISWSPSSDNIRVTGYNVYRDDQYNYIANIDAISYLLPDIHYPDLRLLLYPNQYFYSDKKVSAGKTYGYYIRAHDAQGNYSSFSDAFNSRVTVTVPVAQSSFPHNLTIGSTGSDVKQLQALLVNEVGYSADLITGYFGQITRDAVKRLQAKYGVNPASGYFGEITRRALNALISN